MEEREKEYWMEKALEEAQKAADKSEVPIGAIVVKEGEIIGRGHNLRETSHNATTHAEMLAIQEACKNLDNWRLEDCQLFVTLEPCPMCSGAILQSRIPEVYFGAYDPKGGAAGTFYQLLQDDRFNHCCDIVEGHICEEACQKQLQDFFRALRKRKKEEKRARQQQKDLL